MRAVHFVAATALAAAPATAALAPGAKAPVFTASGAVAGRATTIDLAAALRRGPVVLYFFPAAFTPGCNAEAHAFAEAIPDFRAAGATVIGMTAGNVDQLQAFSREHCAGRFVVGAATAAIVRGYDVALAGAQGGITSRTSYVIAPNGTILFAHEERNPANHVRLTLEAVQRYRAAR